MGNKLNLEYSQPNQQQWKCVTRKNEISYELNSVSREEHRFKNRLKVV